MATLGLVNLDDPVKKYLPNLPVHGHLFTNNPVTIRNERGTAIFVPLAINYIMTKDDRKYFELEAGITPVFLKETFSNNNENFRSIFGHVNFAYRYQPKEGGLFFRAAITPVFSNHFFWPYYAGLPIGYKFLKIISIKSFAVAQRNYQLL